MTKEQLQEIEERAILFDYDVEAHKEEGFSGVRQEAYIKGATDQDSISRADQKKMDIEKACELYRKELEQAELIIKNINPKGLGLIDIEKSAEKFRKVMEE